MANYAIRKDYYAENNANYAIFLELFYACFNRFQRKITTLYCSNDNSSMYTLCILVNWSKAD